MINSAKFSARACTAAQRTLSLQRFFSASSRLSTANDGGWDDGSSRSSAPSVRVIFDAEPDSDTAFDAELDDLMSAPGGDLRLAARHKLLFERSSDAEAFGLWRYKYFRLPGDTTFVDDYKKLAVPAHRRIFSALENFRRSPDQIRGQQRNQIETVRQFGVTNRLNSQKTKFSGIISDRSAKPFNFIDYVQCTVHECPLLIRKDLTDSFPDVTLRNDQSLTVVTICEKDDADSIVYCTNDTDLMNEQTTSVSVQRQQPSTSLFSDAATEICRFLQMSGYWADFVDPFSGKLHSAAADIADEASLPGDDQRAFRRFVGASVERYGHCTVIATSTSSSSDVNADPPTSDARGLIFTSASVDSPVLKFLLDYTASTSTAVLNKDAAGGVESSATPSSTSVTPSPPTARSNSAELLKKIFERY